MPSRPSRAFLYFPYPVYRILLRRFGPQGWWPTAPSGFAHPAYHPGRYYVPADREALEIAVGAILTQNTAWTNVERAIAALHGDRAMALPTLLHMPRARLERLIRSSGYFRQKAARLKGFLAYMARRPGGTLAGWLRGNLGAVRKELLDIPGLGPETADSILLYAGGRPVFVVDAYTLRIGGRLGWFCEGTSYDQAQRYLTARLPRSVTVYQELHALFVVLAKFFCRKEPLCSACPLLRGCFWGRHPTSLRRPAGPVQGNG